MASTPGPVVRPPPPHPQPYSGSMTSPTPSPHPTARAGTHRTRTLVLVGLAAAAVAGLLGLAVGGVGGTLLAGGIGGGSSGSRVDQNISEGCAILDRLEEQLPVVVDDFNLESPLMFELGAAGNHFMAAGVGDTDGVLWTAGHDLVAGTSTLDVDLTNEALTALDDTCANA